MDIEFIYKNCFLKIEIFIISIFLLYFVSFSNAATDVQLSLVINPWQIDYWSPMYLNLWQINLSQVEQNIQWQFGDYFWVSDLAWSDNGYNTHISCDGLVWPNWIVLTWVYLMAWNNGNPELLNWNAWSVKINSSFSGNYFSMFNGPVTYIYRDPWTNHWIINKYWDKAWIRVVVPPYTQPWTYSWTIYFDI